MEILRALGPSAIMHSIELGYFELSRGGTNGKINFHLPSASEITLCIFILHAETYVQNQALIIIQSDSTCRG